MGFVKTLEELLKNLRETADFYDAKMLAVMWETKPEIISKLLPPPLNPDKRPIVLAFLADYPRTNFDVTYSESALFLAAQFAEERGMYCLSMPVTNDIAMAGGREFYGYPKKMAKIEFKREGDTAGGWTERRNIRFMELQAKLTGNFNSNDSAAIFKEYFSLESQFSIVTFNFKHFPSPEGGGFDYNPRLVREEVILRPVEISIGEAQVNLRHSDYDPWYEVEVVRVLGAIYMRGNNSMLKGKIVAELDPMAFAPYSFLKWDIK
ncbi:MAG: acetoacetate decarboxylase family protein [Deltaproteobacteria bacterium]|nr:acetoacetate decarboxylase family protein [Deltaproteobacteria bacterium]